MPFSCNALILSRIVILKKLGIRDLPDDSFLGRFDAIKAHLHIKVYKF